MDTTKQEQTFHAAEAQLDSLLVQAKPELAQCSISFTDRSVRSPNYKEHYLLWGVNFERSWSQGLSTCLVQVWAFCPQPVGPGDPPKVTVQRRAERFRTGQQSSVNERAEQVYALSSISTGGLASIVIEQFRQGAQQLGVAL
jgi:hypothetical protein